MLEIIDVIVSFIGEESLPYAVILLALFNIFLICILGYIYLSSKEDRKRLDEQMRKYDHLICLLKSYCVELEHNSEKKSLELDRVKQKLIGFESDMKHMELSLKRFAPPLEKGKEYKSVTVSGTVL